MLLLVPFYVRAVLSLAKCEPAMVKSARERGRVKRRVDLQHRALTPNVNFRLHILTKVGPIWSEI